jgi:hypothetical protein
MLPDLKEREEKNWKRKALANFPPPILNQSRYYTSFILFLFSSLFILFTLCWVDTSFLLPDPDTAQQITGMYL